MLWKDHFERLIKHQLKHKAKTPIIPQHKLGACGICFPPEPTSLITEEEEAQFDRFNLFYAAIVPEATTYTPATKKRILEAIREVEALPVTGYAKQLQKVVTTCGHIVLNYGYKSHPRSEPPKLAKLLAKTLHRTKALTEGNPKEVYLALVAEEISNLGIKNITRTEGIEEDLISEI